MLTCHDRCRGTERGSEKSCGLWRVRAVSRQHASVPFTQGIFRYWSFQMYVPLDRVLCQPLWGVLQGRKGVFEDHNDSLLQDLSARYPYVLSLEMETFHLFDLARCSLVGPSSFFFVSFLSSGRRLALHTHCDSESFFPFGRRKALHAQGGAETNLS
jgi:hypothetical protein